MYNYIRTLLVICFCHSFYGQVPSIKWDKRYGGTIYETFRGMFKTSDKCFLLYGDSQSGISGDKTQTNRGISDYWIIKIDSAGNYLMDKTFGGNGQDYLYCVKETKDKGYILGGWSASGISGDKTSSTIGFYDYWVIKINSVGNIKWQKRFGGTQVNSIQSIDLTNDGGYILGGSSSSNIGGTKTQNNWDVTLGTSDYWIVKIDSLGNYQWDKTYGGNKEEKLTTVIQTSDKGFILGGTSYSGISGDKTQNNWDVSLSTPDYWIVKTDSLGNYLWDKRYGGTAWDVCNSMTKTTDNGIVMGGYTNSYLTGDHSQPILNSDFWLIKVNSVGTKIWDKRYGGSSAEDDFYSVFETSDKGFVICGTSYSNISGDKSENNLAPEQTWALKLDSIGIVVWDKTLHTTSPGDDEFGYAIEDKNDCFIIGNFNSKGIGGDKTQTPWGYEDYWIVKVCNDVLTTDVHSIMSFNKNLISLYPNPNNGSFNLFTDFNTCELILINSIGQKVYEQKISQGQNNIITLDLASGLYNYIILQDKRQICNGKLTVNKN